MECYKQEPLGTMPRYIEDYIRSCDLESTDVPAMSPDAQVSIILVVTDSVDGLKWG